MARGTVTLPLALATLLALCCATDAAKLSESSTAIQNLVSDVVSRATSTSEVLTLNLTNLIILIVIKAVVIVLGMFAFGGGFNFFSNAFGGFGRSDEPSPSSWLDREDVLLMLTYLLSTDGSDYGCLNRVACEQPARATQYLSAGKLLLGGARFAEGIVSVDRKYPDVLEGMQRAIYHGQSGGVCSLRYSCSAH